MIDLIENLDRIKKSLWIGFFLFWLTETVFFLFKYGWHFKSFTNDEKLCDHIVGIGLTVWFYLWIASLIIKFIHIILLIIEDIKNDLNQ